MGKEVLPYVLQLWCRYADGAAALRDMFNAMESMILQDEQDDEAEGVEGELLLEERVIVNTVVLPWLWWFTAVRKEHVKSRRQPDDATPLVFDVVVDILQRSRVSPLLRGFSLPEEGKEADPRTTDQNKDGGSRLILPVILNLLVAYFGDELRLLSSEQRQVYLSAFLDPAMWSTLLTKYPQTGLKYTLDSIPSVLRVTAEGDSHEAEESVIQHIIPTMLRQVNQLQTYLQCIVLANLSTLLLEHTAVRKYRYVYQSIFAAPALLDGGEDLALGYTWLKQVNTGGQDTIDFVNTNIRRLTFHKLTGAAETVVTLLFQQLYCNTGVEPSVLREIRSFIEKFVCQMWQEDPSSESGDPSHSVALKKRLFQFCVAAVLDRLNAVSKKDSWVDQVDGAKGATAAASKDSWDDWDDDEDEGGVDSMDVAEEVRCAKQTFANIIARSDVVNSKEKFLALCEGNEHIPREQLVLLL
ncbi:hypothetical protein AGDE_13605 [Angomonas deanei]|uniref:Uncharacterized protein n=1 Tax=Angomonas deanei TaxID=59799 RepID=A0A7G2C5G9_9TRYP|nr:hypothetical protein AGDE_13605 [Angomonas deanei]CAD2214381.1 hypothetical protein, conserved [Angomonas deanei]|eukprot:EPY22069.1 hypothetical protein AGDE_13605 [Angomonas deanei]